MYRETSLQFRDQIGHLSHMERAGGDKEHIVRPYSAIFRIDSAAFHNGQNITLHAFPAHIRAVAAIGTSGHLVDLVNKDDALLLGAADGFFPYLVLIDQFRLFFLQKNLAGVLHLDPANLGFLGHHAAHHIADVDGIAAHFQLGQCVFHFNFQFTFFQFTGAQLLQHIFPAHGQFVLFFLRNFRLFLRAQQHLQRIGVLFLRGIHKQLGQPVFRQHLRPSLHLLGKFLPYHADRVFHQIANDAFHIPAHITDFGKLGGFHLHKRGFDQLCQSSGDLRLTNASRADHQNIFRTDLAAHLLIKA